MKAIWHRLSGVGDCDIYVVTISISERASAMNIKVGETYGTEDLLTSLCNSVAKVLTAATHSEIHYSAMVQRITKTCLKPDIGCFVLFDGGFSGLVVLNFSAQTAMEPFRKVTQAGFVPGPRPSINRAE